MAKYRLNHCVFICIHVIYLKATLSVWASRFRDRLFFFSFCVCVCGGGGGLAGAVGGGGGGGVRCGTHFPVKKWLS